MNRVLLVIVLVLAVFALTACVPGPNPGVDAPDAEGRVSGFWLGLWHGIISPISFVISLFTEQVSLYDVHNNGNWYDLGFVLGAGILGGGGALGCRRRRRD